MRSSMVPGTITNETNPGGRARLLQVVKVSLVSFQLSWRTSYDDEDGRTED